jgi:hypothetical protein
MWHRFVDAVRALFGGPKAYQEAYERAIAANAAIDRNNKLAARVEFETLEAKLHSLLDALLQRPELGLSKGGAAQPIQARYLARHDSPTAIRDRIAAKALGRPGSQVQGDASGRERLADQAPPAGHCRSASNWRWCRKTNPRRAIWEASC